MDLAYAPKGSLHPNHIHLMITVYASIVTLHVLEEKILKMGQHVCQVLSKDFSSNSSAFMPVNSKDIHIKLDNVTKQLSHRFAALSSSESGPSNINEGEGRG